MTDATRTATLTTLLADDADARKLVVSWHLVRTEVEQPVALVEWAKVSGVARSRTAQLAHVLFQHGVCRPDHTADPEALRIIQHFAAEQLRATQRGRR